MKKHCPAQIQVGEMLNQRLRRELSAIFGRRRSRKRSTTLPRIVSHFELRQEIGAGAKGIVYLARDRRLNRFVAVKVLRRALYANSESRERFFREAKCASALNHPNIVTVHEFGHDQAMDFVVMEYLSGKTLDRVTPVRGLPLEVWLEYALQMTRAVAAAHSQAIAHRDLKPSNFLIAKSGTVKLLDFGLAKVIKPRRSRQFPNKNTKALETAEGTILGTIGYMSPEQVRGENADQRSDIFSLGAIFYEMLSGRRAFHRKTAIDTMSAILHNDPPKLPAGIPAPIARIVRRCLEKKRSRRYRTATELASDLTVAADLAAH